MDKLKSELDSARPIILDFKYIEPQFLNGSTGQTLNVCGYIAKENLYSLNPCLRHTGATTYHCREFKELLAL